MTGTLYMMAITAAVAFPLGVGAAVYLEEYARRSWFSRMIQVNISNLAGVPSIIYGLLGLQLFVRALEFERSVLAGAFTMALLVMPIIVVAAQESLRAVPPSMREAAYAVGGDAVAGGAAPRAAVRVRGDADGEHIGDVAGDRGDGAADRDRGADVHPRSWRMIRGTISRCCRS